MKSLWDDKTAEPYANDPLALRVYTSRLLGQEPSLVLHGGGNTSVKTRVTNLFGDCEELLYVKGSGWDLASIEAAGFAAVRMKVLKQMAELDQLRDTDMVNVQRSAMTDPAGPNPSVEAIVHALIPFAYVDHTHADAVVTISNTADGEVRIREIYGDKVLIAPYVKPGFILAKTIAELSRDADWSNLEGIILLNHGLFTFADDAKASYENMIKLVSMAEQYLQTHAVIGDSEVADASEDLLKLAALRRAVSIARGKPVITYLDNDDDAIAFSSLPDIEAISSRGPLTPDHTIRSKRTPMMVGADVEASVELFAADYQGYFDSHNDGSFTCLDTAPRWAIWPGYGTLSFDTSQKGAAIISDIIRHTRVAITRAEALGGWQVPPEKDIFEMEYWRPQQAKLKKGNVSAMFSGKVALVTGAASGIGQACVRALLAHGAVVCAIDINPVIRGLFNNIGVIEAVCDVTDTGAMKKTVDDTVRHFGGLDILISNAGLFPVSERIEQMNDATWDKSLTVNLTSHQQLLSLCIPYLKLGLDPAIVIMASKNVPAPGPGAAAYSVAKAGLTQLARVAALELGEFGIRVNALHPNAVFDTAIWTDEVLEKRARNYGLSIKEYKTNNILKVEVTSLDVAELACQLAGPVFAKTTGAQLPIDGGNDRVI